MSAIPRRLALLLVALIALGACGGGDGEERAGKRESGCKDELAVQATTLPDGFDRKPRKGPGGGKDTPKDAVAYHWQGADDGTYIDVFRGGKRNEIEKGAKLTFLGVSGRYKEIPGGLGAKAKLGRGICSRYQFEAFGVAEDAFRPFLTGLRRGPSATDEGAEEE